MLRFVPYFCALLFFADISTGYSQTPAPQTPSGQQRRFQIDLPPRARVTLAISQALEELEREPCDKTAIQNLGKALGTNGYRREAAKAHIRFSETCGGHVLSLREAGIRAGVICAPVLPGITDGPKQLEAVVKAAAEAKATHIYANPLFLKPCSARSISLIW